MKCNKVLAFLLTLGIMLGFSLTAYSQTPEVKRQITEDFVKARTLDLLMAAPDNTIEKPMVSHLAKMVAAYQAEQLYRLRRVACLKTDGKSEACKGVHPYFKEPMVPHPVTGQPVHKTHNTRTMDFFLDRIIDENDRLSAINQLKKSM